jgi:hypothetical protein
MDCVFKPVLHLTFQDFFVYYKCVWYRKIENNQLSVKSERRKECGTAER